MNNPGIQNFRQIRERSENLYKSVCLYDETHKKLATVQEQLNFNLRCKHNDVLPKSLILQPPIKTPLGFSTAKKFGKQYLNCFIQDNHYRINNYTKIIRQNFIILQQEMADMIEEFSSLVQMNMEMMRLEKQNQLNRRFENLYRGQCGKYHNSEWVKNISNKQLSEKEEKLLGKCLNFATQHTKQDKLIFLANVEHAVNNCSAIPSQDKESIRQVIANTLKSTKSKSNLSKEEEKTLKQLKTDSSITIVPADKGRVTVVLDKADYVSKCEEHLSDEITYKKINNDPNKKLKTKINSYLKELKDKGVVPEDHYKKLFSSTAATPLFYGLIKTHKELSLIHI